MKINIYLDDSLKAMQSMPDKKYELAICDSEYGINVSKGVWGNSNKGKVTTYVKKDWDKEHSNKYYFKNLKRISKDQIIFGANHFIENIDNANSSCWIVWDKDNTGNFADCELAYTSFNTAVRKFKYRWNGMLQQNMKNKEIRIHQTQKPVALYKWLLKNYGFNKDGSKRTIFDSHGGSLSIVIACIDMGFDIDIWEIDPDYYRDGVNRVKRHLDQQDAFRETVEINIK